MSKAGSGEHEFARTNRKHETFPSAQMIVATAADFQTSLIEGSVRPRENETPAETVMRQWLATLLNKNAMHFLTPQRVGLFATPIQNLDQSCTAKTIRIEGGLNRLVAAAFGTPLESKVPRKSQIPTAGWATDDVFFALRLPIVDDNPQEALMVAGVMQNMKAMEWWKLLNFETASVQQFTEFMHLLLNLGSWGGKPAPATSTDSITLPTKFSGVQLQKCNAYQVYAGITKTGYPPSSPKGLIFRK